MDRQMIAMTNSIIISAIDHANTGPPRGMNCGITAR